MKAAIVFVLLFATVLGRPAIRSPGNSPESSEELVKPAPVLGIAPAELTEVAPVQVFFKNGDTATTSDESSDEDETEGADPTSDPTSDSTASTDSTDSADSADSNESKDSADSADSDDTNESSESEEADTTAAPPTAEPTVEPTMATTEAPIYDDGRGDSMGYPSDYKKSIIYVDTNNIEKGPSSYKAYGKMDEGLYTGKKVSVYDTGLGNEIEKKMTGFKALQVHDLMEEDTSTPDVESQVLDSSSGKAEEPSLRQAHVDVASQDRTPSESPESQKAKSLESDATSVRTSSASSDGTSESTSTSASNETDSSNSSEEATARPGAADSDSAESNESHDSDSDSAEEAATVATITTDAPVVITAK
ncbi:dentin sialophosphoprotein-like isoform X1 [Salvelinus fontinalis]|uniref:dentin sialophosphoprotein-like isoform X1 n=1 Tax=Salvelinus fontinalis TaxID=8038 RepID=UPI002486B8DE|nr:dentin sialophosphoprotein-like isoform X1 [Salvelinus fontinalis]